MTTTPIEPTRYDSPEWTANVSSFAGFGRAQHFYVNLTNPIYVQGPSGWYGHQRKVDVFRETSLAEAQALQRADGRHGFGGLRQLLPRDCFTHRFNSEAEALESAITVFKHVTAGRPDVWLVDRCSGEPLVGTPARDIDQPLSYAFGGRGDPGQDELFEVLAALDGTVESLATFFDRVDPLGPRTEGA